MSCCPGVMLLLPCYWSVCHTAIYSSADSKFHGRQWPCQKTLSFCGLCKYMWRRSVMNYFLFPSCERQIKKLLLQCWEWFCMLDGCWPCYSFMSDYNSRLDRTLMPDGHRQLLSDRLNLLAVSESSPLRISIVAISSKCSDLVLVVMSMQAFHFITLTLLLHIDCSMNKT